MQSSLKHLLTKKKRPADTIFFNKLVDSCNSKSSHQDIFNGKGYFEIKKKVYSFSKTLE